MAYDTIAKRISSLGFCCLWAYFFARQACQTKDIVEELGGLTPRQVRRWRRRFRTFRLTCTSSSNCFTCKPPRSLYKGPDMTSDEERRFPVHESPPDE